LLSMSAAAPQIGSPPRTRQVPRRSRCGHHGVLPLSALFAVACIVSSCAAPTRTTGPPTPAGVTHVVQPGQNLFRIGLAYGVPVSTLIEVNRLKPSAPLQVGQRLFIPGATATRQVETPRQLTTDERTALERSLQEDLSLPSASPLGEVPSPALPGIRTDAYFVWPLHGPVTSPFGPRNGRLHAGMDIGSPHYQEVVAAADGEVIYAGNTGRSLGKTVVLQHGQGIRTVYAHLSIIIARERDTVRQGQAIGGVGDTGRATGPHLHFEVRRNGVPVNPAGYLPGTIDELVRGLSAPK
jgi:murein DD-endopeptidase MepM/ murein hydrolase activator NlpD